MYDHTFSELANHQTRHQATHKVGHRLGDCIWSLFFLGGLCGYAWINILTLSPLRVKGGRVKETGTQEREARGMRSRMRRRRKKEKKKKREEK